jgi:hypothetical protein
MTRWLHLNFLLINPSLKDESKNIYFREIIDLLLLIRFRINLSTDVNWTTYESPIELLREIDNCINLLQKFDASGLERIKIHFLPTSTFQELAITNDRGEEYLSLSMKFDCLYEKILVG